MTEQITIPRELLQQVLEVLEAADNRDGAYSYRCEIDALRTLLDAPAVEPMVWYDGRKFYATPSAAHMDCADIKALRPLYEAPQAQQPAPVQEPHKDLADAYCGAREDLAIWKKRALEAESELRNEIDSSHRLISELNAQNGPSHMGDPVCKPVQEPEISDAQASLLASALGECILASGIIGKDKDGFSGPELLMFAEDLKQMLERSQQPAQKTEALGPEFEKVLHDNLWELYDGKSALQPRKAVKLTEAEIHNADPMPHGMSDTHRIAFGKAIEAAVLKKNGLES